MIAEQRQRFDELADIGLKGTEVFMGFVAEYISAADMDKYKIKEIDEQVEISWRTHSDQWVVDREREMYLRRIAAGRDELSRESAWNFYWRDNLFWMFIELVDGSSNGRNAPGWGRKKIVLVRLMGDRSKLLPPSLVDSWDETFRDLEAALLVYKDGGVYSATTEYKLYLEVAEGALV